MKPNKSSQQGLAMMPWFHRDFLASTQGWTAAESGLYFLLLGAQWEMGPLSEDPTQLASIARAPVKEFKAIWAKKVGCKFRSTPDGLINDRLEEHRKEALRRRDQHRNGAQQTNAKRWRSGSQSESQSESQSDALGESQSVSPPSPSPSPTGRVRACEGGDGGTEAPLASLPAPPSAAGRGYG